MKIDIKKKRYFLPIISLVMIGLIVAVPANAGPLNWLAMNIILPAIAFISWVIVAVCGKIAGLLSSLVVSVAQFNDFTTSAAVSAGWPIIRDLCNSFFILILLVVAFATILHLKSYNAGALLKYVLIYAILINFSKAICGLIIDFAQAIMQPFVGAIGALGGADFLHILGIDQILNYNSNPAIDPNITFWDLTITYVLMVIYAIVAVVVIGTTLMVFAMRIVMLWIYIILSPLAYLTAILPATKSISSQWWTQFTKYVVTGPALAFFIWLSFSSLNSITSSSQLNFTTAKGLAAGSSAMGSADAMLRFIMAICMLVAGLMVAQGLGGVTGAIAGGGISKLRKGADWAKKGAAKPFKWAGRKTKEGVVSGAKAGGSALKRGTVKLAKGADAAMFKGAAGRGFDKFSRNVLKGGALKDAFHKATGQKFHKDYTKAQRNARRNNFEYTDKKTGKKYKKGEDGVYRDDNGTAAKVRGQELRDFKSNGSARFSEGMANTVAGRKREAEQRKKQTEKFTQYDKDYEHMSGAELRAAAETEGNSEKRTAIYMRMAEKKEFDGKGPDAQAKFDEAQETVRKFGGEEMLGEFSKKVNSGQAHLNYKLARDKDGNYKDKGEFEAFKTKAQKGEIKLSDQKATELNGNTLKAFKDSLSPAQFSTQAKNLYTADERFGKRLKDVLKEEEGKVNPNDLAAKEKFEKDFGFLRKKGAELTGDVEEFYGERYTEADENTVTPENEVQDADGNVVKKGEKAKKGELKKDREGIKIKDDLARKFMKNANINIWNNLDVDALEKNPHLKKIVIDSVDLGTLKNMEKKGENPELVRYLVNEVTKPEVGHVNSQKIVNDPALNYYVNPNYDLNVVKKNQVINKILKTESPDMADKHEKINQVRNLVEETEQHFKQEDDDRITRIRQRFEKGNEEIDLQNIGVEDENKLIDRENVLADRFNQALQGKLEKGELNEKEVELLKKKPIENIVIEEKIDIENSPLLKQKFKPLFGKNEEESIEKLRTIIRAMKDSTKQST